MNKILILLKNSNDLSEVILNSCKGSLAYDIEDDNIPFEKFDSVCILGGTEEKALIIPAKNRIEIEKFISEGKPVFCEFVCSVSGIYCGISKVATHNRLVYSDKYTKFANLENGDILDGHYNDILPYYYVPDTKKAILTYHDYVCAHDNIKMDDETFLSGDLALWYSRA